MLGSSGERCTAVCNVSFVIGEIISVVTADPCEENVLSINIQAS